MNKLFQRVIEDFCCASCGADVHGNGYTNHCTECFCSLHVDIQPGDRASACKALMKPIEISIKTGNGFEKARILHRCAGCGHEKWNETSDKDNEEKLLDLMSRLAQQSLRGN